MFSEASFSHCVDGGRGEGEGSAFWGTFSGGHCSGRYPSYWNASLFKDLNSLKLISNAKFVPRSIFLRKEVANADMPI